MFWIVELDKIEEYVKDGMVEMEERVWIELVEEYF